MRDDLTRRYLDIDILIISGGKNFPGVAQTHKTLHKLFELDDDNKTFNNGTRGARQARLARESKDLSWPQPDLAPVEPSKDDHRPSDEIAPGQYRHGRPCRLHNLKTCMHADCSFSHTPDNNSIRDIECVIILNFHFSMLISLCPRPLPQRPKCLLKLPLGMLHTQQKVLLPSFHRRSLRRRYD